MKFLEYLHTGENFFKWDEWNSIWFQKHKMDKKGCRFSPAIPQYQGSILGTTKVMLGQYSGREWSGGIVGKYRG